MGKSTKPPTSGPDWQDVETAMRAVGSIHGGMVSLTILPWGAGATGGLRIAIAYSPDVEQIGEGQVLTLSESAWPCKEGCTLEGHVFSGIYALDFQLTLERENKKARL